MGEVLDEEAMRGAGINAMEMRKSVRVLLAEYNFLNMKLTMSQLQKLGYVAESVANGKEALEALKKNAYDIILMDCQMPIVDGYQPRWRSGGWRRPTASGGGSSP